MTCINAYFVVKKSILYYVDYNSRIYFNLENLKCQDILIYSIMYLVKQHQKQRQIIFWIAIHQFLLKLKRSNTKLLCCFLKETLSMKNERTNCIESFIGALRIDIKKKYSKQKILALLNLIGVEVNKAVLITKNYISIFNKSSLLLNFSEKKIQ